MASFAEKIEPYAVQISESGCMIWTRCVDALGYGRMYYKGRSDRSHRVSFVLSTGSEIPDGKQINHHCDIRCCVNPDHLYLGDKKDNVMDMVRRNRHASGRPDVRAKQSKAMTGRYLGDANPRCKIKACDRQPILNLLDSGEKMQVVAALFNVNPTYLYSQVKKWRNACGDPDKS
jgi:hypothetical protein